MACGVEHAVDFDRTLSDNIDYDIRKTRHDKLPSPRHATGGRRIRETLQALGRIQDARDNAAGCG